MGCASSNEAHSSKQNNRTNLPKRLILRVSTYKKEAFSWDIFKKIQQILCKIVQNQPVQIDDYEDYTELIYEDQSKFTSYQKQKSQEGKGKFEHQYFRFEGQWRDKKIISGQARWKNKFLYNGDFKNNLPHMKGTLSRIAQRQIKIYEGQWNEGEIQGEGIIYFDENTTFKGSFRKGKMEGSGIFQSSHLKIKGHFEDNKLNGLGKVVYQKEKYSFKGQWKDNKKNGKGVEKWGDGNRYSGEFKDDSRHGYGQMIWSNGEQYRGEWINDQPQKDIKSSYKSNPNSSFEFSIW